MAVRWITNPVEEERKEEKIKEININININHFKN